MKRDANQLLAAIRTGDAKLVSDLLRSDNELASRLLPDGRYPLEAALETGRIEVIRRVVAAGAPLGQTSKVESAGVWQDAIIDALHLRQPGRLLLLLAAGIAPDTPTNDKGSTALMSAAWCSAAMTRLLLKAGADVDRQDLDGYTALMYAASTDDAFYPDREGPRIVHQLLGAGADATITNKDGETALEIVSRQSPGPRADAVAEKLLSRGA